MIDKARAEFIVKGMVQGVGFRYFVWRHANDLWLKGYVRNNYDGSVQVIVEGSRDSIDGLRDLLKKGPSRSWVESCTASYSDFSGEFINFDIR